MLRKVGERTGGGKDGHAMNQPRTIRRSRGGAPVSTTGTLAKNPKHTYIAAWPMKESVSV